MSWGKVLGLKRSHRWLDRCDPYMCLVSMYYIEKQFKCAYLWRFLVTVSTLFLVYTHPASLIYIATIGPMKPKCLTPYFKIYGTPSSCVFGSWKMWTNHLIWNTILRWYFRFKEHWGVNILLLWSTEHSFSLWFYLLLDGWDEIVWTVLGQKVESNYKEYRFESE